MSESPGSPRARRLAAPSWLDGRLVLGVLLVLVSVVVGARVLAGADRSQLVWATTADLAVGSQLAASDLRPVRVRLFDSADRYLDGSGPAPVGYVIRRGLGAGELLPDDALVLPEDGDHRLVTVALEAGRYPPDLANGQEIDVWVTPVRPGDAGTSPDGPELELGSAEQILARVVVASAPSPESFRGGSTTSPVVLRVRADDVGLLVSALSAGRMDLVRVPRNAEAAAPAGPAEAAAPAFPAAPAASAVPATPAPGARG